MESNHPAGLFWWALQTHFQKCWALNQADFLLHHACQVLQSLSWCEMFEFKQPLQLHQKYKVKVNWAYHEVWNAHVFFDLFERKKKERSEEVWWHNWKSPTNEMLSPIFLVLLLCQVPSFPPPLWQACWNWDDRTTSTTAAALLNIKSSHIID